MRGLGVRTGVGLCSVLFFFPYTSPNQDFNVNTTLGSALRHPFNILFHSPKQFTYEEFLSPPPPLSAIPYTPLAAENEGEEEGRLSPGPKKGITLSASDKWRLVKPLFGRYMLPLCVYPSTASFHGNSPITCSLRLPCAFPAYELYTRCLSHSTMQFEYTITLI